MDTETRVALLVDGENLPADHAGFAIKTAVERGRLIIKRVHGSVKALGKWVDAPGFRIVHSPPGKNIGDLSLSLDALELALTRQADHFVIGTSDRDLALIALRLTELGFPVTGLGRGDTNAAFRKACRDFVSLPEPAAAPVPAKPAEPRGAFADRLASFIRGEGAQSDGWVSLSALGHQKAKAAGISKAVAGIGKSASWLDWFKKHDDRFQSDGAGTNTRVKVRTST